MNILRLQRMAFLLSHVFGIWVALEYFWSQPTKIEALNDAQKCYQHRTGAELVL